MSLLARLVRTFKKENVGFGFGSFGSSSILDAPRLIDGAEYISIGSQVHIREGVWLGVYPRDSMDRNLDCKIVIQDKTYIGFFCTITATNRIEIGNGCVISDGFYTSDSTHGHDPRNGSPRIQPLFSKGPVQIGDDCFIGMRVSILPGVTLGKHCVVGAHSVVTHSFPDCSMIAGVPARLIKKFNYDTGTWESVVSGRLPFSRRI
jgi:lipopolysaccharide O-acetyltransferase